MIYDRSMDNESDYYCYACGSDVDILNAPHCTCEQIRIEDLIVKPNILGRTIRYPRNWVMITNDYEYVALDIPASNACTDLIMSPVN